MGLGMGSQDEACNLYRHCIFACTGEKSNYSWRLYSLFVCSPSVGTAAIAQSSTEASSSSSLSCISRCALAFKRGLPTVTSARRSCAAAYTEGRLYSISNDDDDLQPTGPIAV